jgi:hypothetical protein
MYWTLVRFFSFWILKKGIKPSLNTKQSLKGARSHQRERLQRKKNPGKMYLHSIHNMKKTLQSLKNSIIKR